MPNLKLLWPTGILLEMYPHMDGEDCALRLALVQYLDNVLVSPKWGGL